MKIYVYTIYDHPGDYPNHFVVRCTLIYQGKVMPDDHAWLAPTLEQARLFIPPGLNPLPRNPEDDPVIVECWL
jgi:hypothetical protein